MAVSIKKSKNDLVVSKQPCNIGYQNKRTMTNAIIPLADRRFISDDSDIEFTYSEFVEANQDELSEAEMMEVKLLDVHSTEFVGMCEITRVK